MASITASFEILRSDLAIIELTEDRSGEWRGSFRVDLPTSEHSAIGCASEQEWLDSCHARLYDRAYDRASTEAHLHGGYLGRFVRAA